METPDLKALYSYIAHYAAQRRAGDGERAHTPTATYAEQLERFHLPVRDEGVPAEQVIHELIAFAEPGLAAVTGPRFHGWVMGGSNPVGVAADSGGRTPETASQRRRRPQPKNGRARRCLICCTCRMNVRSASSQARRWRTSPALPPRAKK